jgi:hypothetical protein
MKAILATILLSCLITFSFSSPLPIEAKHKALQINSKSTAFEFGTIHVHRQGDGVAISWNVSDNSIVSGFYVQRSYDGTNYVMVGTVPGESTASWYRYTDELVFPGFINYRLVAVLNDGTEVTSTDQSIRIIKKK